MLMRGLTVHTPIPGGPALPLAATACLHMLLLAVVFLRWETESRVISARVVQPKLIDARLVILDEAAPKQPEAKPSRPATAPRRQERVGPAPKTTAPEAAAPRPKAAPSATPARPREQARQPAPEAARRREPPGQSREALAEVARRELAAAVAQEEQRTVAVTAEEMAASYAALIQATVEQYWSRPPSARNDMQALLAIQLVPSGDVVSVSVLESSGSVAFDRSAVNAVEKAGAFPELANLPDREFERTFRRFRLLFRPEDLRY